MAGYTLHITIDSTQWVIDSKQTIHHSIDIGRQITDIFLNSPSDNTSNEWTMSVIGAFGIVVRVSGLTQGRMRRPSPQGGYIFLERIQT